ncbi:50S ribosomal protein L3 N(5)-glutamine methyltransferase [Reinekea forsetii]|nr:50S ribosomal protein L3 N(5)-glutamine methyltransferase [Reinekea forsetii]
MQSASISFPHIDQTTPLKTVGDWIRFCASQMELQGCFYGHGFATPWDEARFLVLRSLNLDWDIPDSVLPSHLLGSEIDSLYQAIQSRCIEKIPTAYLLEEAWFMGEPYKVTPNVLIPRSPIAELIGAGFEPWITEEPGRALDLCTGSGCIGIAMARVFPNTPIDISDLSQEALSIATENIADKELGMQVQVYQGDLFSGIEPTNQYDLIVSNPPYVDQEDIDDMPEEFHHEPRLGLAAGFDGLDLVHKMMQQAPSYLSENGWLVCEVGNSAAAMAEAYPQVELIWPEFEQGGHGVFIVSARELSKLQN